MPHTPARFDLTGPNAIVQGEDWTWPLRVEISTLPAPPFFASSPYLVGNYLTPTVANGFTYYVTNAGTAAGTEPTWPTVKGARVTSGTATFMAVGSTRMLDTEGYLATFVVSNVYHGAIDLSASVANGRIAVDYDPPTSLLLHAYLVGAQVMSTTVNGWVYECIVAGTSGAAAPTWPTALGQTVTDGTVTWRCVSTDAGATNLRVTLSAAYTAGLVNWGAGMYTFEIVDTFGNSTRILEGLAELSQEVYP